MKRKTGYSFEADCATLVEQVAKGKPQPVNLPTKLPLADIQQWPKVFQHRSFLGSESESHVRSLAAAIKKSRSKALTLLRPLIDDLQFARLGRDDEMMASDDRSFSTDEALVLKVTSIEAESPPIHKKGSVFAFDLVPRGDPEQGSLGQVTLQLHRSDERPIG